MINIQLLSRPQTGTFQKPPRLRGRAFVLYPKNRQHTVSVEMAQAATRDINVGIAFGGTAKFGDDYKVLDLDAKSGAD